MQQGQDIYKAGHTSMSVLLHDPLLSSPNAQEHRMGLASIAAKVDKINLEPITK